MKVTETILDQIMVDVRAELGEARQRQPVVELKRMVGDAPAIRSFSAPLQESFGLIAEIKERSPSHGPMRPENVADAPAAYEKSGLVKAISVLTNNSHFGMSMERLREMKMATSKPLLRKDFIFDDYQVYQARAYGADAILLMANLLDRAEMERLYRLARDLQMEALFECHTRAQIEEVPVEGKIFGINSRTFDARKNILGVGLYGMSNLLGRLGSGKDLTVDEKRFELAQYLPAQALKVAESGVSPENIAALRDTFGYHAALVGTSLLTASHGVEHELERFEQALAKTPVAHS
jgi:indole-3-glycerol phosphate synthase